MKDSLLIMNIHRHLLHITAKLITVLEHHTEKQEKDISPELKMKYKDFRTHAHNLIEEFNNSLHHLIKIDTELKELEDKEIK
jgi:hypothetical protein